MELKALKSAKTLASAVFFMMIMIHSVHSQNRDVDFLIRDTNRPLTSNILEEEHEITATVGPVEMTVAETLYVIETSMAIPDVCDASADRASMVSDVFTDAIIEGTGTVAYEANSSITGVLSFDKAEDRWVNLNSLQDDLAGKNRSVFMWVKSELDVKSNRQVLLGMNAATGTGNVSNLLIDNTGENLEIYDGGNFQSASFDMGDGKWHYVGYTYDNTTTETVVYVDGIENDRFNNKQEALTDTRYSLGQEFDGTTTQSDHFNGDMAEISIWDEVLTAIEIREGMAAKIDNGHTRYANLVGYYSVFGSCTDDTNMLTDHSGKGNHGLMQNFTVDFKNVQSIAGFNAIDWYDNLVWKKDGTQVATGGTFTASLVAGSYEFIATRDFVESTDSWAMTLNTNAVHIDEIADETLCTDDEVNYAVDISKVSYLDFEKSDENFVKVDAILDDLTGTDRSIFMWVNKESSVPSGTSYQLLTITGENGTDPVTSFYINSSEKLGITTDGSDYVGNTVSIDTWTHVGYTYNATTEEAKLFINGEVVKTASGLVMPVVAGSTATMGMRYDDNGPSRFLDGKLAEVTVWNKALTLQEVTAIMEKAPASNASNLAASYGQLHTIADNRVADGTLNDNAGYASHSSIIVKDEEVSIPDYDASNHYSFSWTREGTEVGTEASLSILPEEGVTNYSVSYGASFFNKTDDFALSYTELLAAQPSDISGKISGTAVFSVPDVPGATYQWYNNEESGTTFYRTSSTDNRIRTVYSRGENVYIAAGKEVRISNDGGETWSIYSTVDDFGFEEALNVLAVSIYATEDAIFVGANGGGISKSTDNGASWDNVLSHGYCGSIIVQGNDVYASNYEGISISRNLGRTWSTITSGSGFVSFSSRVVTKTFADGDNVYVGGWGAGLSISTNDAQSWRRVRETTAGFPSDNVRHVWAEGDKVYVGTDEGLAISEDGGGTWRTVNSANEGFAESDDVRVTHVTSSAIYAGTDRGLSISEDGGLTWKTLTSSDGLPNNTIVSIDAEEDNIYIATNSGLFVWKGNTRLQDISNTSAENQIQGATTHELRLNNLTVDLDQSTYYVEVKKDICTSTSDIVKLTVSEKDALVTLADVTGAEDDGGITVTARLDNAVSGGFTVEVSTVDGTATIADGDYTALTSHTLTFTGTAGEEQTFTISPTADIDYEDDETLTLVLSNLANTSVNIGVSDEATVTITNDDIEVTNVGTDVFIDAVIDGADAVTYQANTNATGVLAFEKSSSQWVDLNALQDDLHGTNRSVFMWIKSESDVTSEDQVLFGMNVGGTSTSTVSNLLIDNDGENLEIYDGSNYQSASYDLGDGQWHYIGYTYDDATTETVVYVDGIENDRYTNNQSTLSDTRYSLGQEFDGTTVSNFYNGNMAEVSVWDDVLTGAEIREAMKAKINNGHPKYANLVGYYSIFGEKTDDTTVLKDHSGKGNDGLMQNGFTVDFNNVQVVKGFNAIDWYENLSWKKDNVELSTGNTFTINVSPGNYEFSATRNFIKSTDTWAMTLNSNDATVDNIADETLCTDDQITLRVSTPVNYLEFEETEDNYVEVNSVADDLAGSSRSVFMWLNKESSILSGDQNNVFALQGSNLADETSRLYIRDTEKLALWNGNERVDATTALANDTWYFIGYTYDATTKKVKMYVNGELEGTGTEDNDVGEGWMASLGQRFEANGQSDFFDGKLAEISIWTEVLTQEEISALMLAAPAYDAANLVALYGTLQSIADNRVFDLTAKNNDGLASHSSIIVSDAEAEIADYDASSHYNYSWSREGTEVSTGPGFTLVPEEGTTNYQVVYGLPFFEKTEDFALSFTSFIPGQPADQTAAPNTSASFEVDNISGATYQWFQKTTGFASQNSEEIGFTSSTQVESVFVTDDAWYVGTMDGLSISDDYGDTWTTVDANTPGFGTSSWVLDIHVSEGVIYVGTTDQISISKDQGETWSNVEQGEKGFDLQNVTGLHIDDGVIYASGAGKISISKNEGASWSTKETPRQEGKSPFNSDIYAEGSKIYVAVARGFSGGDIAAGGLLISNNEGSSWTTVDRNTAGFPDTYEANAVYVHEGTVYVGTDNGLAISSNGGTTWTQPVVADGYLAESQSVNAIHAVGDRVYVGSGGVQYTEDGQTWTQLDNGTSASMRSVFVRDGEIYYVDSRNLYYATSYRKLEDETDNTAANQIQGVTTRQLTINNLSLVQTGAEYYVEVTKDGCTQTSDLATLTVDNSIASLSIADVSGAENNGAITVTVSLDNAVAGGFTVDASTGDGTATTADNDYTAVTSQVLNFAGTAGEQQTFTIMPTPDTDFETDETLTVSLSNLANTALVVNISAQATVTITNDDSDDVTAPAKPAVTHISDDTGISSTDGITSDRNLLIYGTAEANATVEVFSGANQVGTIQADANGDWTLDITAFTLTQGSFDVTVEAIDAAGNRSVTSDIFVLTIDFSGPVKPVITGISDDTGSSNSDGITSDRNLLVHGTAEANATVDIFSGTFKVGTVQADANGDWTLDITAFNLTQNTSNVTAEAIDAAGNRGLTSDIFVLTIDYTAPAKPIITGISDDTGSSNSDGTTSDRKLLIHGTAEANTTVEVFSPGGLIGSVACDANGDWTLDITAFNLPEMVANTTAEAIDVAGNRSATSDAFVITIDFTAPAKPVITGISDDTGSSATDGITSDRKLLIHGNAEANATVEVFSPGGLIGSVAADVNGDWTLDITAFNLPEMVANTTAEAIDVAGNRSATSDSFVITIDFTAPAKPVITGISDDTGSNATDGITNDRQLLIHGTAEANTTVEVFSPGGLIGSAIADVNGDWTLDITAFNLPEMVANTTAEAIDAAGNRSATSDGFVITIDFTSPAVAISIDNNSVAGYLINATFDEDVSGFDLTDISVTGGTASALTQLSPSSYTFLVNSSGSVADVTVNANGAEDVAGNANTASNQLSLGFTPVSAREDFTSLKQSTGEPVKVSVYPNPASSWLIIDLSAIDSDRVDVAFVNTSGIAVLNHNNFEGSELRVDVSGYKSGMYLVLISAEGLLVKKKFLIRK